MRRSFSGAEANRLRKAMATFRSRGQVDELEDMMVGRMVTRGYDPDFAQRCFNQIRGFGEYGFPESHAASFAHLVYVSSWLKCHFPAAFACALLNSQPMGFYAPAQIVRDAREHGVAVLAADVNFRVGIAGWRLFRAKTPRREGVASHQDTKTPGRATCGAAAQRHPALQQVQREMWLSRFAVRTLCVLVP